ncbi:hypothetical protein KM043_014972 [Ampulex compressa]|nr:hypothetical protein KM043_014972 [Ampulex compressa]
MQLDFELLLEPWNPPSPILGPPQPGASPHLTNQFGHNVVNTARKDGGVYTDGSGTSDVSRNVEVEAKGADQLDLSPTRERKGEYASRKVPGSVCVLSDGECIP